MKKNKFYQCPKGKGLLSIDVFDDDFFVFCSCCFSLVNFSIEDFINDPTRRSFRFCTTSLALLWTVADILLLSSFVTKISEEKINKKLTYSYTFTFIH